VIYRDAETGRTYNYTQVKNAAIDFGKGLKANWDWKRNDVMNIYSPNCIDTPIITWGTHWAGGIISPANPAYTVDELAFQLKDSGAKAIATQKAHLEIACAAAKKVGIPKDRIILIGDERDPTSRFKPFTSVKNLMGASRYRRTKATNPEKDLAFLVYSSGTTGHPKGVMLSHTNIVANLCQLNIAEGGHLKHDGPGGGDRILGFLPFFHM
jgi:4-coumarate--CoA ligase